VVQITSAMSIAKMVGSNRIVLGHGIVHVTGDAKLAPEEEKRLAPQACAKSARRTAIERKVVLTLITRLPRRVEAYSSMQAYCSLPRATPSLVTTFYTRGIPFHRAWMNQPTGTRL
jgi:hypothetical protein